MEALIGLGFGGLVMLVGYFVIEWHAEGLPTTKRQRAVQAARHQAQRDVEGSAGTMWYELDAGALSLRQFEAAQKAYVKEVERLTDYQVRERVNSKALEELSERTRNSVRAHRKALDALDKSTMEEKL